MKITKKQLKQIIKEEIENVAEAQGHYRTHKPHPDDRNPAVGEPSPRRRYTTTFQDGKDYYEMLDWAENSRDKMLLKQLTDYAIREKGTELMMALAKNGQLPISAAAKLDKQPYEDVRRVLNFRMKKAQLKY